MSAVPGTLRKGLAWLLFEHKAGVNVVHIDWQAERAVMAVDVRTDEASVVTVLPPGPWVTVDFTDASRFAIWKRTGAVYVVDAHGAAGDEPLLYDQEREDSHERHNT